MKLSDSNLFHSASLKLAGFYLLIMMSISLVFSIGLYRVASDEVERSIRRQTGPISQMLRNRNMDLMESYADEQNELIQAAKDRLKTNLFLINSSILLGGGMLSYYFARKTLQPIEESHEAQSRFTADASHELRTPITAMRIETELALTDPKLDIKAAKRQLESNIEELDKLTALSDGLLKLARMNNEELELSKTALKPIVESAVKRIKPMADKKTIRLKINTIPKVTIPADEASLSEALTTLLDNAVKYSPQKTTVEIGVKNTKNKLIITISDQGYGIAPRDLTHIFDRFYRADQSRNKEKTNGYGLGLSIAKGIVESHGGSIKAESQLGNGSKFIIVLPA